APEMVVGIIEPVRVGGPALGDGIGVETGEYECSHNDPTLKDNFQRSYDLYLEDGSGNRSGPFRVRTSWWLGCAHTYDARGSVLALGAALVLASRRRRA